MRSFRHFSSNPSITEKKLDIAEETCQYWNYRNVFGAADSKHILIFIVKPKCSGSYFCNYKGFYCVVLTALVEYGCKFLAIYVEVQRRISDRGVY